MGFSIAVTGKGGVGKTTLAGLTVLRLAARGLGPVLAVDADPNICLDRVLGLRAEHTVGRLREEARQEVSRGGGMPGGMAKHDYLELRIAESLVEGDDFDLIAMGRPEGPGCYCFANSVLRDVLGRIADNYRCTVIDNEAGLENLSRRLTTRADLLVVAGDPSARGLETMRRLHWLALEMDIRYESLALVVNRVRRGSMPDAAQRLQEETGASFLLGLPDDAALADLDEAGLCLDRLPADNPVVRGVDELLDQAGLR